VQGTVASPALQVLAGTVPSPPTEDPWAASGPTGNSGASALLGVQRTPLIPPSLAPPACARGHPAIFGNEENSGYRGSGRQGPLGMGMTRFPHSLRVPRPPRWPFFSPAPDPGYQATTLAFRAVPSDTGASLRASWLPAEQPQGHRATLRPSGRTPLQQKPELTPHSTSPTAGSRTEGQGRQRSHGSTGLAGGG
jgi:hypothetical protein